MPDLTRLTIWAGFSPALMTMLSMGWIDLCLYRRAGTGYAPAQPGPIQPMNSPNIKNYFDSRLIMYSSEICAGVMLLLNVERFGAH